MDKDKDSGRDSPGKDKGRRGRDKDREGRVTDRGRYRGVRGRTRPVGVRTSCMVDFITGTRRVSSLPSISKEMVKS